MGISTREEGLLKLVLPGRRVEIHTEPMLASEVLKKYPRHCIARPDVFKFPWIVVRPEAVLLPGKVFYIVPRKTIYDLLQAKRQQNQQMPLAIPSLNTHNSRDFTSLSTSQTSLLKENQNLKNHGNNCRLNVQNTNLKGKQFLKNHVNRSLSDWSSSLEGNKSMNNAGKLHFAHRNSPLKSTAGMTPKHLGRAKHPSRFRNSPWYGASYEVDDFKENRHGHENFSGQSIDDSSFDSTFMHSKRYYYRRSYSPTSRAVNHHRQYTISSNKDELKSCLRNPDSERGRLRLRVTFGFPIVTNFFTY